MSDVIRGSAVDWRSIPLPHHPPPPRRIRPHSPLLLRSERESSPRQSQGHRLHPPIRKMQDLGSASFHVAQQKTASPLDLGWKEPIHHHQLPLKYPRHHGYCQNVPHKYPRKPIKGPAPRNDDGGDVGRVCRRHCPTKNHYSGRPDAGRGDGGGTPHGDSAWGLAGAEQRPSAPQGEGDQRPGGDQPHPLRRHHGQRRGVDVLRLHRVEHVDPPPQHFQLCHWLHLHNNRLQTRQCRQPGHHQAHR
mmetsp:Transcript_29158/g.68228  ORF Transcript_29158/g.68228 Transcript_29158/m.68228 type:complete len:246 (-) Transcript_29158:488-1225(-)